jgi:para-aminobenzoate synthetase/4-amino-4-deoxychorismate lyase
MRQNLIILRDGFSNQWLRFENPYEVLVGRRCDEVLPILERTESASAQGGYAAGFLAYEAAGAFDSALRTQSQNRVPLIWFGLYPEPTVLADLPVPMDLGYSTDGWLGDLSVEEYIERIRQIRECILEGETYQVNFTFRLKSRFHGNPYAFFVELCRFHKPPFAAYLEMDAFTVCSTSPELFFCLDHGRITTRPMKGTIARGRTTDEDRRQSEILTRSEKEQAENLMVVDMIRSDLGKIAKWGSVATSKLFSAERYPRFWQMTSTVESETDASVSSILTALFPSASVTGAPKPKTMEIITRLESSPRGLYTGSIGYIAPDRKAQFNVAIRTAVIHLTDGTAEYGTGGGIVWDSTAESEYRECLLKGSVVLQEEPEFSLLETLLWEPEEEYFLLEYHLRRLRDSAGYFDIPYSDELMVRTLSARAASFSKTRRRVRLLLGKNGSPSVESAEISFSNSGRTLTLKKAEKPVDSSDPFLFHKTTHRRTYDEARHPVPDCDDVVLWNEKGEVTETTTANLVVEWGNRLITPPMHCGLLAGTFRAWLLDHGRIEESPVSFSMLEKTKKIFAVNSVQKWQRVVFSR